MFSMKLTIKPILEILIQPGKAIHACHIRRGGPIEAPPQTQKHWTIWHTRGFSGPSIGIPSINQEPGGCQSLRYTQKNLFKILLNQTEIRL